MDLFFWVKIGFNLLKLVYQQYARLPLQYGSIWGTNLTLFRWHLL